MAHSSREYMRQWRKEHPDYNDQWKEAHPNYQREWRRANPERMKKLHDKWNREHPDRSTYARKKADPDFLRKARARNYVQRHPELRGSKCEFCPNTEDLQTHHPDYDIQWLVVTCCASCHAYIDKGGIRNFGEKEGPNPTSKTSRPVGRGAGTPRLRGSAGQSLPRPRSDGKRAR